MNKIIMFGLLLLMACSEMSLNDSTLLQNELPECINSIILDPVESKNLVSVRSQISQDKQVYWLNTNFTLVDGSEYIISSTCDTLCYICGECIIHPDCLKAYTGEWTILWQR